MNCGLISKVIASLVGVFVFVSEIYNGLDHYHPFTKILLPEDSEGKCLDGTPNGYYLSKNPHSNNLIFYFDGGGFCNGSTVEETIESCYKRSLTKKGSSEDWPKYISIVEASIFGILNHIEYKNPNFYDWNKVYIKYCDGAFHTGHADVFYNGTTLYFRGEISTKLIIGDVLKKANLNKDSTVILSGMSAGGVAAMYWADYVKE